VQPPAGPDAQAAAEQQQMMDAMNKLKKMSNPFKKKGAEITFDDDLVKQHKQQVRACIIVLYSLCACEFVCFGTGA